MYEYTPVRKKTREMTTALLLLGVGIALLYVSRIQGIPYPVLWQTGTFVLAVAAVLIVGRFVMRSYTYCVEAGEGEDPEARDLVIVEHYGRRNTVVCRVGLNQIRSAVRPESREARAAVAAKRKGKRVYHYTAAFSVPDLCVAEVGESDETFFLYFCADQALFDLLHP